MTTPVPGCPSPTPAEEALITAARDARDTCRCGGDCSNDCDPVTDDAVARMLAYLAAHPGHQFAYDDTGDTDIVAVIRTPHGHPDEIPVIIEARSTMADLLDAIGAPASAELS